MVTAIQYALMAGASYISTRAEPNQFPTPDGWLGIKYDNSPNSGFEVISFVRTGTTLQTSTEIVISFAGTTDISDWVHGNTLSLGMLPDQLRQAADYYLQIKASTPANASISFTGHSLGGGLASLMAVMFGESAFTFDQAPFRSAALMYPTTEPITGNVITHSVAQDLLAYLQGEMINGQPKYSASQLNGLTNFITALNSTAPGVVPNEGNVTDINVSGEILALLPFSRIGAQADIPQQNNLAPVVGRIDLHSQALLTAFLQSNQTAEANKGLSDATFKLNDLLKMIFDPKLFSNDPNNRAPAAPENFLERIVKHQAGIGTTLPADEMVKRFTADLWQLARDGGLTISDGNENDATLHKVSNALIAFAMQYYYEDTDNSKDSTRKLFSDAGDNGLRFDIKDVSTDIATAIDQMNAGGADVDLAVKKDGKYLLKGYESFAAYLPQDEASGQTFVKLNGGASLVILKQDADNRILINDWPAAGALGISLQDNTPTAPTPTLTGDFKKLIDTKDPADPNDDVYKLDGNGNYEKDGDQANALDLISGTAGNDVINGGGGDDALLGMAMLRSTPKNGQKPIPLAGHARDDMAANDHAYGSERSAA